MMKNTLIIATVVCFLLAPLLTMPYSAAEGQEVPPVAQNLVREGDFAVKLAEALGLDSSGSETEAVSVLAAAGIAPRNGWIADYPVTPDILGALETAVGEAADAGRLTMMREEAVQAFQGLAGEIGLAVAAAPEKGQEEKEPPQSYPKYSDPTVINNYYYNEGPPVVTYYPPPWDYYYLYAWVPYPFYWRTFWFPGFFILHDFNRVVFVKHRTVKTLTNHVFEPRSRRAVIVDHRSRARGKSFKGGRTFSDRRRFDSLEARRGASSIVERSRNRSRYGDSSPAFGNRGTSTGRPESSRPQSRREGTAFTRSGPNAGTTRGDRTGSFNSPGAGQRLEGRRPEAFSGNRGGRSFNRPDASSNRSGMRFNSPSMRSGSGSGRGGRGGSGREMRGGGGSERSARGRTSGSGCRGRC